VGRGGLSECVGTAGLAIMARRKGQLVLLCWIGAGRAVQNISMHLRQLEPTKFTTCTLETRLSSDHVCYKRNLKLEVPLSYTHSGPLLNLVSSPPRA
jgi:hypothetical protein